MGEPPCSIEDKRTHDKRFCMVKHLQVREGVGCLKFQSEVFPGSNKTYLVQSATLAAAAVPHAHVHTAKNLIFTSILRYCHLASSLLYFFSVYFDSLCSHINNHICPEGKNLIFFSLLSSSHLSVL